MQFQYGSLWRRCGAGVLDLWLFYGLLYALVLGADRWWHLQLRGLFGASFFAPREWDLRSMLILLGFKLALAPVYFALSEAARGQATPGKWAMRLQVTDVQGRRITFGRALLRLFARVLSGLPSGLGYVLAAWTVRRQCLHDPIAGTLVVLVSTSARG